MGKARTRCFGAGAVSAGRAHPARARAWRMGRLRFAHPTTYVVHPTHRLLKRRNAVNFTQRFEQNLDAYQFGKISFAELDACVQGWINHVRYADTWGLRGYVFAGHPIPRQAI